MSQECIIQPSEPSVNVHKFSCSIQDSVVHFQVLKLTDSFMIWIGTSAKLKDLSVALQTKYDSGLPTSTQLLGDSENLVSSSLSKKLAKKTGKQVFVSYNLSADSQILPQIEARIIEEIAVEPDKF